ncbi:MAG: hypothetical protein CUN55_12250 [Phototrophicales bacterium]|nr:MAG: hypothetical protein CUN55_12250 [Phototrophicales bacterium]
MAFQNLVGSTLGQYELEEFLGKGGMGVVYRAFQPRLKRYVAVKILSDSQANRPEQVKRFHREAEISASLEHPHIVPIYDYGTENGMNYVVMRLLSGGSLSDHIEQVLLGKRPRASLQEITRLLQQIAGALDYAHARNVIHRDIKPSNVMFDDSGHAFLVDFGLVKLLDSSLSKLTGAGMILGTPAYMAPEQWRDEPLSPATDQYALGILIFFLLTGQLPFDSDSSPYELMQQHCEVRPPDVHLLQRDIPSKVSAVIHRALAKDPKERYPTASEFATAFAEASMSGYSTNAAPSSELDDAETFSPGSVKRPTGHLRVEQSRDESMVGTEVTITKSPFTIGRLSRDLNFNGDRNVSRNHAHIIQDDSGDFFIIDQGSTLHTVVNSTTLQPLSPFPLRHYSRISLGTTTVLLFTIH